VKYTLFFTVNLAVTKKKKTVGDGEKLLTYFNSALKRLFIPGGSRLVDITSGGDFLGLCDQKSSYKHVSDFGRLRSYDRLKLRIEGNDY
jgi:hypothetical protein